jgi:hypothetical protein
MPLTSTDLIRLHGCGIRADDGWPAEPQRTHQDRALEDSRREVEELRWELRSKRFDLWLGILIGAMWMAIAERWVR